LIVGVNAFQDSDERPLPTQPMDERVETAQRTALRTIKQSRDAGALAKALAQVRRVAQTNENLMPALLDAAQVRGSVGEIMTALADVFGRYEQAAKW
jgi:methylmalonyl-CoA mutase N-terminal domain/subunit